MPDKRYQLRVSLRPDEAENVRRLNTALNMGRAAVGNDEKNHKSLLIAEACHIVWSKPDWTPEGLFNCVESYRRLLAAERKGDRFNPDLMTAITQAGLLRLIGPMKGREFTG